MGKHAQKNYLAYLVETGEQTAEQVASHFGVTARTACNHLSSLKAIGLVDWVSFRPKGAKRRLTYWTATGNPDLLNNKKEEK